MFSKINPRKIVAAHLDTLLDHRTVRAVGKHDAPPSRNDIVLFLVFPLAVGALLGAFQVPIGDPVLTATVTAFSVFAGLLFNFLALTYELIRRTPDGEADVGAGSTNRRRETLREVHANVSFAILTALFVVLLSLPLYALPDRAPASYVLNALLVALALNFSLTLLMVLKRMHILIDYEAQRA